MWVVTRIALARRHRTMLEGPVKHVRCMAYTAKLVLLNDQGIGHLPVVTQFTTPLLKGGVGRGLRRRYFDGNFDRRPLGRGLVRRRDPIEEESQYAIPGLL